jgi:hypothetical protein
VHDEAHVDLRRADPRDGLYAATGAVVDGDGLGASGRLVASNNDPNNADLAYGQVSVQVDGLFCMACRVSR